MIALKRLSRSAEFAEIKQLIRADNSRKLRGAIDGYSLTHLKLVQQDKLSYGDSLEISVTGRLSGKQGVVYCGDGARTLLSIECSPIPHCCGSMLISGFKFGYTLNRTGENGIKLCVNMLKMAHELSIYYRRVNVLYLASENQREVRRALELLAYTPAYEYLNKNSYNRVCVYANTLQL